MTRICPLCGGPEDHWGMCPDDRALADNNHWSRPAYRKDSPMTEADKERDRIVAYLRNMIGCIEPPQTDWCLAQMTALQVYSAAIARNEHRSADNGE